MTDRKTSEEESHPEIFDNPNIEIETLKSKCQMLEKNLYKSQIQIQKNEILINKLQDMISLYGKNTNNTSNSFMLPSEFKSNWESLVKDLIMEAFENIFDCNVLLAHMVQETMLIVYNETKNLILDKIGIVMNSLSLGDSASTSLISNEKFFIKFRILFQEYFSSIFKCTEQFISKTVDTLRTNILQYPEILTREKEEDIKRDLQSKSLNLFIQFAFKLCVYMHLHDPPLTINITTFDKRKLVYHYYIKSEFLNIEGFGRDRIPCLVILPPPLIRNNFSYQGIKPTVYIVSKTNEEIIQECEKNKGGSNISNIRAHSSGDLNGGKSGSVEENDEKKSTNIMNNSNANNNNSNKANSNLFAHNSATTVVPIRKKIFRETSSTENSRRSSGKTNNNNATTSELTHEREEKMTNVNKNQLNINNYINKLGTTVKKKQNGVNINHPGEMNCGKKLTESREPVSIDIKEKIKDKKEKENEKITPTHINNNITATTISSNPKQCIVASQSDSSSKVNRSTSHKNVLNPSRNASVLENFNNSQNKDSLRTNDGVAYQKSSRLNKTPLEGEIETWGPVKLMNLNNNMNLMNNVTPNERNNNQNKNLDYHLNDKLNNISNSFSLVRNKAPQVNEKGTNGENRDVQDQKERDSSIKKKKNENVLRLNLNANQTQNKNYQPTASSLGNNSKPHMKNVMCINIGKIKSNYEIACLARKKSLQEVESKKSNYESSCKISEPKAEQEIDKEKEEMKECRNLQTANAFLYRNNSQSSDIRYEGNVSMNSNSNQLSVTNTNTSISKVKLSKAPLKNLSYSPRIISSNKAKSLVEQNSSLAGINASMGTAIKTPMKLVYLDYQNNSHDLNSNTGLTSGVMFNSREYFILNDSAVGGAVGYNPANSGSNSIRHSSGPEGGDYCSKPFHNSRNENTVNNTDEHINGNNPTKVELLEGRISNRISTNANYENASSLLNDMKYNGPKKDEFNLKISQDKGRIKENCSNNTNNINNNANFISTGSPKNIMANIAEYAKIKDMYSGITTHNPNTYTVNYKEKILNALDIKTGKQNVIYHNVNSNVSNSVSLVNKILKK